MVGFMKPLRDWFHQTFSDPQVLILTGVLLVALIGIVFVAEMIAPVIAAIVFAFLLDGLVVRLERLRVRKIIAIVLVFTGFILATMLILLGLLPILVGQAGQFVKQIPLMTLELQEHLLQLPQQYPDLVSEAQVRSFMSQIGGSALDLFSSLPSLAGASVAGRRPGCVHTGRDRASAWTPARCSRPRRRRRGRGRTWRGLPRKRDGRVSHKQTY